jgi:hypothetical protein
VGIIQSKLFREKQKQKEREKKSLVDNTMDESERDSECQSNKSGRIHVSLLSRDLDHCTAQAYYTHRVNNNINKILSVAALIPCWLIHYLTHKHPTEKKARRIRRRYKGKKQKDHIGP